MAENRRGRSFRIQSLPTYGVLNIGRLDLQNVALPNRSSSVRVPQFTNFRKCNPVKCLTNNFWKVSTKRNGLDRLKSQPRSKHRSNNADWGTGTMMSTGQAQQRMHTASRSSNPRSGLHSWGARGHRWLTAPGDVRYPQYYVHVGHVVIPYHRSANPWSVSYRVVMWTLHVVYAYIWAIFPALQEYILLHLKFK
jgi:hypothetical protein